MGTPKLWAFVIILVLAGAGVLWFLLGPTGQAAVQAIDDTSSEVTGKRALDQYQPMRQEAKTISREQKDRLQGIGLEGGTSGESQ
jgi:hypothetical protein